MYLPLSQQTESVPNNMCQEVRSAEYRDTVYKGVDSVGLGG